MKHLFYLTQVLLFLSSSCNGQTQIYYPDIINQGFNILGYGSAFDVNLSITFFYNQIENYDRYSPQNLSLYNLLHIYGDPQQLQELCKNYMDLVINEIVPKEGREQCKLINQFTDKIHEINSQIENINDNYRRSIEDREVQNRRWRESVNNFYKSITSGCDDLTNASGCFFYQVAGNESKLIREKIPFHPTRSIHQEVYLSYLKLAIALLKNYAEEMVRIRRHSSRARQDMEIEKLQTEFALRASDLGRMTNSVLRIAPRDITPLDPDEHIEDITYIRLKWFVEQIIVNEANLNKDASCWKTCDDYRITEYWRYGNVPSKGNDVCNGVIHRCYWQSLGHVCPADPNTYRRYSAIRGFTKNWENYSHCLNRAHETDEIYAVPGGAFDRCDVCTCLCDDFKNPYTVRRFSLRPVTSNVEANMVITGLRFHEIGGIIYIAIQEGQLLGRGGIDVSSRRWLNVETFGAHEPDDGNSTDYFTMRYLFERSVSLDTLSTGDEYVRRVILEQSPRNAKYPRVLTGIRLARGNASSQLILGVRLTAVNPTTGRLVLTDDWDGWVYSELRGGTYEIELEQPDISIHGPALNIEVRSHNQYVKFQPTDNRKDFGQTTVPFLDKQDVVAEPPIPLSGAGLYYKGQKGYGGFIGLKLMSFDFSEFVATELSRS